MAKGKKAPEISQMALKDVNTPLNNWVEVWTPEWRAKVRNNDAERLYAYVWQGYTPNEDGYLYSPSWKKSNVRVDWSIEWWVELFPQQETTAENIPSPETTTINPNTVDRTSPLTQWGKMNANLNFNDYWDDSSPENQSTPWWLREKNTWEWVATSNIAYNPNADINNLWGYKYWEEGRQENARNAGYLARRNDEIASALYNAWLVEKSDIIQYLANQPWWNNSTEADRVNTVESIWKRIGQMSPKWENNEVDYSRLDNIRGEDTSWTLYWKTTADEWNPEEGIPALSDANSIYRMMEESRMAEVKDLLNMWTDNIAAALDWWEISEGSQKIRDYKEQYPELWNEVQTKLKQIRWQWVVDAITTWWTVPTNTNWTSWANNSIADFASENAGYSESMVDILKDIHQTVSSNSSASSANQTMADIEDEMATLTNRLQNLEKEANKAFNWDAPDYLIKAYINNRTQEIQNKLQVLSDRYKYASSRYDKEVANAQWEKEYALKEKQVKIQEEEFALKDWQIRNWITSTVNPNNKSSTNSWDKYQVTTMTDAEVWAAVDELVTMLNNWQLWNAQCWVWLQRYYFPMLWISISGISDYDDKLALINEWEDYIPKKWDLIILSSKSKPWNWHIWVVIWVDKNWTVQYLDWNGSFNEQWEGSEKAQIHFININDSKVQWFRNINKNQTSNAYGWTDTDYANFEKLLDPETDKSEVEAIALKYGYKDNVSALTQIAREAIAERWPSETPIIDENSTWVDYIWLTDEQIKEVEKNIGYNPNAEWYFKTILDSWEMPKTWPAMQNALKVTWAKDERQLWQWIEHYQNKVNAEAVKAWEDVLLLLAQLQNLYRDYDREKIKTKDWKKVTEFDTNAWQWWWRSAIWIKYEQLINQLLLNKVTEARAKWATFWQMTEYEWDILKTAASDLKIKTIWSTDKSFSKAFFDLVDATWRLTHDSKNWPTATQWENYLNQVKNEWEWYMTPAWQDSWWTIDGSNLWWSQWTYNIENNDSTMWILFGTGS